eukprot:9557893-Alexandrium_andersonii.AAC.1
MPRMHGHLCPSRTRAAGCFGATPRRAPLSGESEGPSQLAWLREAGPLWPAHRALRLRPLLHGRALPPSAELHS